jgi:hypothetical protein
MNGERTNFRSVQDLLDTFYGGSFVTQPEESSYTIGALAVQLGAAVNGMRISVVLSNCGTTNIFAGFNAGVTATSGIAIAPKASYRFDWYYDGDLVSRVLYAISDAGGGKLYMLERFLTGA